ncbi:DUF445 domain-containing protein [Neisseriaceae bacterium ESL0693]|nr:DUF445 domain-containing protein [Neisseriaceae bacterium ESL0693]
MPSFNQQTQQQRLYQSRLIATSLLLLALTLFIISCIYLHLHPFMAYLKAFAEAAMVGALADWFAITALFRHPLGLPIPHTAILVHKQNKIADELGRFIEHNFLQSKAITARIYQWHPTQKALNWLAQPAHQQQWLPQALHLLPPLMSSVKPEYITRLINQLIDRHYNGAKLGNTLANTLTLLHQQNIDIKILRIVLHQLRYGLHHPQTRTSLEASLRNWAGKIEKQDPNSWDKLKASFKTTLTARVDDWVATKALDWADSYLKDALNDPQHPLWRHYRRQYLRLRKQLRHNPHWHQRLASIRQQLTQSDALLLIIEPLWQNLIHWSEHDIDQPDSWWQQQSRQLINQLLKQSHAHPRFMLRLDARLALWIKHQIEHNKHHAAQFVADKVKSWDSNQMIDKIELSIGRDLQFIRINGTLVGGLIGLIIYAVSQFLTT